MFKWYAYIGMPQKKRMADLMGRLHDLKLIGEPILAGFWLTQIFWKIWPFWRQYILEKAQIGVKSEIMGLIWQSEGQYVVFLILCK